MLMLVVGAVVVDKIRRKVEAMLMVYSGNVYTVLQRSSFLASNLEKHGTYTY